MKNFSVKTFRNYGNKLLGWHLLEYGNKDKKVEIKKVCAYYFSGTETTKKICEQIAKTAGEILNLPVESFNFANPQIRENHNNLDESLIVFGMPVIAGRVPNLFVKYLKKLKIKNSLGVAVVLYGNRNFDDALVELRDLMNSMGITVIGCGAFIGEHSFSRTLAKGRPNSFDLEFAKVFSEKICSKILENNISMKTVIRGKRKPYRKHYMPRDRYGNFIDIRKVKPVTNIEKCTDCKLCVQICPTKAIDKDDVSNVTGICMKCCGCIKRCPEGAKTFIDKGFIYHKEELEYKYSKYKKNKIYL